MSAAAGLQDARRHRRALAGAAAFWTGESVQLESGQHVLGLAEERTTGVQVALDARPTRWRLDLATVARRLALCERSSALRRRPDGSWEPVALGCGVRLCPVCARARAARTAVRWRPVLDAAIADGAEVRHWTLTHRTDTAPGGVVLPHERDRYRWAGEGDARDLPWVDLGADLVTGEPVWGPPVGQAVGGESLLSAYDRLRGRVRRLREDRGSRVLVRDAWQASILGVEWTGREPRTGVPRWHAHAHVLTVSRRALPASVVQAVIRAWQGKRGRGEAGDRSQRSRVVQADGVAEVLKYPFKPAGLTSAQRIEVLAAVRGVKPHQVGGAWHGRSALHRERPWADWLAQRPEPEARPRLHLVPRRPDEPIGQVATGDPVLWTGQVDTDEAEVPHTWAVRDSGAWVRWVAPAAEYLRALGAPTSDLDLPEPGSDEEED